MNRLTASSLLLAVACSDQSVKAFNATPEATITAPGDGTGMDSEVPLTLMGRVSHPDDDAGANAGKADLFAGASLTAGSTATASTTSSCRPGTTMPAPPMPAPATCCCPADWEAEAARV